jgi:hypothetical protein
MLDCQLVRFRFGVARFTPDFQVHAANDGILARFQKKATFVEARPRRYFFCPKITFGLVTKLSWPIFAG